MAKSRKSAAVNVNPAVRLLLNKLTGIRKAIAKLEAIPPEHWTGWVRGQLAYFQREAAELAVALEGLTNGKATAAS